MMGHKICLYQEKWLIIPKLSLLPLLIWSTESTFSFGSHLGDNSELQIRGGIEDNSKIIFFISQ